ncbi:MAG: DUF4412 domain-containing protein [Chitinophagales bacterium]
MFLLSLAMISHSCFAQFEDILTYEDDYDYHSTNGKENATGVVLTNFYESNSKVLVRSRNTPIVNGKQDTSAAQDQNKVVFDFGTQKQMTIDANAKKAIVTGFMVNITNQVMKTTNADITIQNHGPEKIGQYSCTHFEITNKKNRKDIDLWITKDLGTSNNFFAGPWLYYPRGSLEVNKLVAAGGDGVVLKWKAGKASATLASTQNQPFRPGFFDPPKGYTVVEQNFPGRQ